MAASRVIAEEDLRRSRLQNELVADREIKENALRRSRIEAKTAEENANLRRSRVEEENNQLVF